MIFKYIYFHKLIFYNPHYFYVLATLSFSFLPLNSAILILLFNFTLSFILLFLSRLCVFIYVKIKICADSLFPRCSVEMGYSYVSV